MTGWEEALVWSAGGPNRAFTIDRPNSLIVDALHTRDFSVKLGLVDEGEFIVFEFGFGDTLDEAAANALAAWRKRML